MYQIIILILMLSCSTQLFTFEIIEQSDGERKCIGELITLKVIPDSKPDSVIWHFNEEPINDAKEVFLKIPFLRPENSGIYYCKMFKNGDSVQSNKMPVYAVSHTQIVEEPEVQPFFAGNDYSFKVKAHANGIGDDYIFEYQWFANGKPMSDNHKYAGTSSSVLSIKDVELEDIKIKYHCLVKGLCGYASTEPKQLIDGELFGYIESTKDIRMCYEADEVTINVDIDSPYEKDMKFRWRRAYVGWIDDNDLYTGTKSKSLTVKNEDLKDNTYFYFEVTIDELNYKKEFGSYHIKKVYPPTIKTDIPDTWTAFDHDNGEYFAKVNLRVEAGGNVWDQAEAQYEWYRNGELYGRNAQYPFNPEKLIFWADYLPFSDVWEFGYNDFMTGIWQCRVYNDCYSVWSNKCTVKVGNPDLFVCKGVDTSIVFKYPLIEENEELFWTFEEKPIYSDNIMKSDTSLYFNNVNEDNIGEYVLNAKNNNGVVREIEKVYLRLSGLPDITTKPDKEVYLNSNGFFDDQYFCFNFYDFNIVVQLFKDGMKIAEREIQKLLVHLFVESIFCIKVGSPYPSAEGEYYVKVISDCNEYVSEKFKFIALKDDGKITKIDDSKKHDMLIFPNPSQGTINIESGKDIIKIEIYDQLGNLIDFSNNYFQGSQITFNGLGNGVYNVLIYRDKGILKKRIIVMQ